MSHRSLLTEPLVAPTESQVHVPCVCTTQVVVAKSKMSTELINLRKQYGNVN